MEPSRENYLAAREELFAISAEQVSPVELEKLAELLEDGAYHSLRECLAQLPPIAFLLPRVHFYAAAAAQGLGDIEDCEMEKALFSACLNALLRTGTGEPESPYIVCSTADEYDVLSALKRPPKSQMLVQGPEGPLDVIECLDGSEYWFDISALSHFTPAMKKAGQKATRQSTSSPRRATTPKSPARKTTRSKRQLSQIPR